MSKIVFSDVKTMTLDGEDVIQIALDGVKCWEKTIDYSTIPLCLTAVDAGATIALKCNGTNLAETVFQTSTDGKNWNDYTYETEIILNDVGDKVYFRAKTDNTSVVRDETNYLQFTTTQEDKLVDVSGNPMSLYAPQFADLKDLSTLRDGTPASYAFAKLFLQCKNIHDCSRLILVATTLAGACYYNMFYNCSSLTQAPELPATALASGCYNSMFYNCSGLTAAPTLPATQLASACYYGMFQKCTALKLAPALTATQLADNCYKYMFSGCSGITAAPTLPATQLASNCYQYLFGERGAVLQVSSIEVGFTEWISGTTNNWFAGAPATGTFRCPEALPEIRGNSNIPNGWTIVRI